MVKYRYMWYVNDVLVRDVTSAGQSDILARDKAGSGDEVLCCIIPHDGKQYGDDWHCLSTTVAITGDANGDMLVNVTDLDLFLQAWGSTLCLYDVDDTGLVGMQDLITLLINWGPC